MIIYQIFDKEEDTLIALDVSGTDSRAALAQISGSPKLFAFLKAKLSNRYDPFGHFFNPDSATAIDLNHALNALKKEHDFDVVLLQGEDSISDYDPNIPEAAIT